MSFHNQRVRFPLWQQILAALALGAVCGSLLHRYGHGPASPALGHLVAGLNAIVEIVLRLLRAIAGPLILVVIIQAVSEARIGGRLAGRLIFLLILNASVAVLFAALVMNVLRPGEHGRLPAPPAGFAAPPAGGILDQLLALVPTNFLSPLMDNRPISTVLIALAIGVAARQLPAHWRNSLSRTLKIARSLLLILLQWILRLLPIAVTCKIAAVLIVSGVRPLVDILWFVLAVLVALALQSGYYLLRQASASRIKPYRLLRGTSDALLTAFSTASSLVTMPVSYQCLTERVGVAPEEAALGVFVGGNFNHDGAAIYEACSALFVAQAIGWKLSLAHQIVVILTSMAVSIGAAGIPEAGLVTLSLVFAAVGLPLQYVALLLPVDWFLDRCRTTVNVLGDLHVTCMLEKSAIGSSLEAPLVPGAALEREKLLI